MIEGKGLRQIRTRAAPVMHHFPRQAHRVKVLSTVGAHFDGPQVLLLPAAARLRPGRRLQLVRRRLLPLQLVYMLPPPWCRPMKAVGRVSLQSATQTLILIPQAPLACAHSTELLAEANRTHWKWQACLHRGGVVPPALQCSRCSREEAADATTLGTAARRARGLLPPGSCCSSCCHCRCRRCRCHFRCWLGIGDSVGSIIQAQPAQQTPQLPPRCT